MENSMLLIPIYFCCDMIKNSCSGGEKKGVRLWSDNFFFLIIHILL
jgi:hypothetical protein